MAVTRLKRKAKRNKVTSKVRKATIQRLNSKPVLKTVDVEKIKEEFAKGGKKAAPKAEKPEAEVAEKTEAKKPAAKAKAEKKEAPKAKKKAPAKKAAPKANKEETKKEDK